MFSSLFILIASMLSVRVTFSSVHHVVVSEGSGFMVDGYSINPPLDKSKKITRGWVFSKTPYSYCKDGITLAKVCVDRNICDEDIILNKRCSIKTINYPLSLAMFSIFNETVERKNDVYFINDTIFPIITANKSGINIKHALVNNSGVYTLYENSDNGWSHQSVFWVTVNPKQKDVVVNKPKPPAVKKHGGFFHLKNYHSHVYVIKDSFKIELHLESEIYDKEFTANVDWYYMKTNTDCPVSHIYETCIFHPHARSCLNPRHPTCSFTSPLRATSIVNRSYFKCDPKKNWTSNCVNSHTINTVEYIKQESNNVDLIFSNTPSDASGLYVFVLRYNGHPEIWTYTLVSTVENFVNVIKDVTRPTLSDVQIDHDKEHSTPIPTESTTHHTAKTSSWTKNYITFVAVISCTAVIILILIVIFGCVQYFGLNRKPYEILNPFGTVYTSLPTNEKDILQFEKVTDSDSLSDDSFDSDSDEEVSDLSNRRTSSLPEKGVKEKSGYTIWFNEDLEESSKKKLSQPDYTKVVKRLKSILK
ncbi:glycoprotein E [Phocid alphaherpesvirus 1]|uniref:Envelope glycoprotein E n=1 Tax=Phocid alphaherpesvirus 1 TaxID=47418 RepID=Q91E38_9ALPH|nr:glycoprotein E [Phocid alphaherpesvirus 1]CAC51467.1 glycoprotein E [Phocid alphaherpesvirus 1]